MKITYSDKSKINGSNNSSFFKKLCNDSPYLIINTECGVSKYKFNKIGYDNNDELVLEYILITDKKYIDSFKMISNQRNTNLIEADIKDISSNYISEFPYLEHPENISLALKVCQELGIDWDTSVGMYKKQKLQIVS